METISNSISQTPASLASPVGGLRHLAQEDTSQSTNIVFDAKESYLLRKALLLTAMYDSNNMEALTKNHNTCVTETVNIMPDSVQESISLVTETVNKVPDSVQDSTASRATASLAHSASSCDSNCKCRERLKTLAQAQKSALHKNEASINVDFDNGRISSISSQVPTRNSIPNKELTVVKDQCVRNKMVLSDGEKRKECLVFNDGLDKPDIVKSTSPDNKSNIENNAVTTNETSGPGATVQKKSPDEYLPIDNCHLKAMLKHGQAFGIKFPIQTKLSNFIGICAQKEIEKRMQTKISRHRLYMKRPQTKDVENRFVCSIMSKTKNQDTLLYPSCLVNRYVPSDFLAKKIQQHKVRSKNRGDNIPYKDNGSGEGTPNLQIAEFTYNKDCAYNPKSTAIVNPQKHSSTGVPLRTILDRSATLQSQQDRSDKRAYSFISKNINEGQNSHTTLQSLSQRHQKTLSRPCDMYLKRML